MKRPRVKVAETTGKVQRTNPGLLQSSDGEDKSKGAAGNPSPGTVTLTLGFKERVELRRLAAYAEHPANGYFLPKDGGRQPGVRPESQIILGDVLLVVYMVMELPGGCLHRVLSVGGPLGVPEPWMVFTIASVVGFTGAKRDGMVATEPGNDWATMLATDSPSPYVCLTQPLTERAAA